MHAPHVYQVMLLYSLQLEYTHTCMHLLCTRFAPVLTATRVYTYMHAPPVYQVMLQYTLQL